MWGGKGLTGKKREWPEDTAGGRRREETRNQRAAGKNTRSVADGISPGCTA